jgi:hypothetical protein
MDIIEQLEIQAESVLEAIDGNPAALVAWDNFLEGIVAAVEDLAGRFKSSQIAEGAPC